MSYQWSTYVAPYEAGDELMAAYRAAVSKRMDELCSAGRWPTPQEISDTATPDLRTIMTVLLETRTWEQYTSVSSSMINSGYYQASSEVMIHGQHAVTVTADRIYLRAIEFSIDWVSTAHPDQISDEILRCVEKIRSMRPDFVARRDYSRYADADLEYQLNQHRLRLLSERMA
ncbi:hypothetical protein ACIBCN_09155 [Nocardia sp. NPDC051052]|uniref:hypothetical protein n=1 Tax=Nocardia sp. NPDC051052 TaxID=3364322 RepID=UPI00378D621A